MRGLSMERAKGIEPSYEAWEASVLPLNYARVAPPYSGVCSYRVRIPWVNVHHSPRERRDPMLLRLAIRVRCSCSAILCDRMKSGSRPSAGIVLAFPRIDHDTGDRVADDIGGAASHVEDVIDGEDQKQSGFGQMEEGERRRDHHDGSARHAGHAFARYHQQQQKRHLLREREGNG